MTDTNSTTTEAKARWNSSASTTLLVVAAEVELVALLEGFGEARAGDASQWQLIRVAADVEALATGVGKANAAGALAKLVDPAKHAAVINLGLAGALPAPQQGAPSDAEVELLDVVLASRSVLADEGLATPTGFTSLAAMGFAPLGSADKSQGMELAPCPSVASALTPIVDRTGPIATVSTCSGTQARARALASRWGAIAEAMEGAALAMTLRRLAHATAMPDIPFAEVRVISNTTGERARQRWQLADALAKLGAFAPKVHEHLRAVRSR